MSNYVKQEGGNHYQAEYQHWDMVIDTNMHYLLACATKYIQRKKGGSIGKYEDLKKAMSFVKTAQGAGVAGIHANDIVYVHRWLLLMNLTPSAIEIIDFIVTADYTDAILSIEEMLND